MITMGPVTPLRTDGVLRSSAGGAPVLFNPHDRRLHVLNESAAAVWDRLDRRLTFAELAHELAATFETAASVVQPDVERVIERFAADGLVGATQQRLLRPQRFDRPSGPVAVTVRALDAVLDVIVDPGPVADVVTHVLGPLGGTGTPTGWVAARADEEGLWQVTTSLGAHRRVGTELAAALRLISEVNNAAVAGARDNLVLHAGAVASHGRAVVMPGSSNRGKSTLTAALVRAGFRYLTDEAAALAPTLSCRAYPKAIALDPGSFSLFPELRPAAIGRSPATSRLFEQMARREWHIAPETIGTVGEPTPVHAVVCPHWRAGASTRVARLTPTEALHTLLSDAFDFGSGGQPVFETLTKLVSEVPVYRVGYGDLDDAIAAVTDLVA